MLKENNVNMMTHVCLFIKESAKHMQNTSNTDLDTDVILAMMWMEDGREKRNLDGAFLGKKCFYEHLLQNDTEYPRQKLGNEMKVKNSHGYQRGGHVYNNEYNRKFPSRIDN